MRVKGQTVDESVGDLAKSVTRVLVEAIGRSLRRVIIRALEGEVSNRGEFADPQLHVGGEVRLDFEGQSVFVSWVQNEGWPVFCSIGVRPESLFMQDSTLVDWEVSDLDPWRKCNGQRLLPAQVFAIDDTPQVVEFSFGGQGFWVASGCERRCWRWRRFPHPPGALSGARGGEARLAGVAGPEAY